LTLDRLLEQQAEAQQQSIDQFNSMMQQLDKQHDDRMKMMIGLINAIVGKGKGKKNAADLLTQSLMNE